MALAAKFDDWKAGKISTLGLNQLLHEHDYGESRRLWAKYSTPQHDLLVALGLVHGLLSETEIGSALMEQLSPAIDMHTEDSR